MTDRCNNKHSPTRWVRTALLALGALAPGALMAHPGDHAMHGFAAGAAHPWFGLDHLIAMVLVGVWAMQLGGKARWALPVTFVTAMTVGSFGAFGSFGGAIEPFIALSVLMLGALVALRARLSAGLAVILVAAFAVMHGAAHGLEMPIGADRFAFTAGFALSTLALHLGGLGAAFALLRTDSQGWLRAAGASAAVVGAVLMVQ